MPYYTASSQQAKTSSAPLNHKQAQSIRRERIELVSLRASLYLCGAETLDMTIQRFFHDFIISQKADDQESIPRCTRPRR